MNPLSAFLPLLRPAVFTTLSFVGIASAAGCSKPVEPPPAAPYAETAIAQSTTITPSSSISGIAAPYKNVAIQSSLTEPTDAVYVRQGDHVHQGQLLAQLDTADLRAELESDLATAQNYAAATEHNVYSGGMSIAQGNQALNAAQASLKQAQANLFRDQQILARANALLKQGYISVQQEQIDAASVRDDVGVVHQDQANIVSDQATVQANGTNVTAPGLQSSSIAESQAEERMALSNAGQVRVQIAKTTIVSPINGIVVNRNLNPGEYPGTRQIFTIQQTDPMYVYLRGSSSQIAGIKRGAIATITAAAAAGHTITAKGTVSGVLDQIVPGSTQFQVVVTLQNPHHIFRSGMPVQGYVALPAVHGVGVPSTAFTDENRDMIQIVQPNSTVKSVHVTEVASDGSTAIVSGVDQGTRVISNSESANLGDGEKVSYER